MIVMLGGCGRLGFDHVDDGDGDDTDVADDSDIADDTDADDTDADDTDDTDAPPIDSPSAACQTDPAYVSLGAFPSRYRRVTQLTSWANATRECTDDGAHLAVPDTMDEAIAIGDNGDWVGITDVTAEGVWMTIFDTVPAYLQFQTGQPDGGEGEECLRVDGVGEFEDRNCGDARDFVCECPL